MNARITHIHNDHEGSDENKRREKARDIRCEPLIYMHTYNKKRKNNLKLYCHYDQRMHSTLVQRSLLWFGSCPTIYNLTKSNSSSSRAQFTVWDYTIRIHTRKSTVWPQFWLFSLRYVLRVEGFYLNVTICYTLAAEVDVRISRSSWQRWNSIFFSYDFFVVLQFFHHSSIALCSRAAYERFLWYLKHILQFIAGRLDIIIVSKL